MNNIQPSEVIKVLNKASVKFVLVGAYGLAGWIKKPRATEDVDVVVAGRHLKKATAAILAAFPQLELDDHPIVLRFRNRETKIVAVDVIKPLELLYQEALKQTEEVGTGAQFHRIPSLEMALALKFAPMISLHRQDKDKFQDAHDFMYMVDSNPEIDLTKLQAFGDLTYKGGGVELVEMVRKVRAGEKLVL